MTPNTPIEYPYPFSLRLTFEERAALERKAGNMPLGAYIRKQALEGNERKRRRKRPAPGLDDQALSRLLGELGRSNLANNLNQLTKAAHSGSLPVTPETEHALQNACAEVKWMRETLMQALGLKPDPQERVP